MGPEAVASTVRVGITTYELAKAMDVTDPVVTIASISASSNVTA